MRWMDRQIDGWVDGRMDFSCLSLLFSFSSLIRCVVDRRRDAAIEFHYFHPAVPHPAENG